MANKIVLVILLVALSACQKAGDIERRSRAVWNCPDESVSLRHDFILQCIKNANPKSDEEPEDWIHKCERFSNNLYCKKNTVTVEHVCLRDDGIGHCSEWAPTEDG